MMKKLLFLVADGRYFLSHRQLLAKAAVQQGWQVGLMTPESSLQGLAVPTWLEVFTLKHFHRTSLGLMQNIQGLREMRRIIKHYQPSVLHSVGVKCVLLSTLLAVPKKIGDLGGLGYIFTACPGTGITQFKRTVLKNMVFNPCFARLLKDPANEVLIQNPDDLKDLKNLYFWKNSFEKHLHIIPGSGIDMSAFEVFPLPPKPPLIITCASRLLKDKGIGELIQAADLLKDLPLEIHLYGAIDPYNPSSFTQKEVDQWDLTKDIVFKGFNPDINQVYQNSHIAILPSYREGLPRSLLEGASCGRPIITTDVPGCRQTVIPGITGWLVPSHDPQALAHQIRHCFDLPLEKLTEMGQKGRSFVQAHFSDTVIHNKILTLYNSSLIY